MSRRSAVLRALPGLVAIGVATAVLAVVGTGGPTSAAASDPPTVATGVRAAGALTTAATTALTTATTVSVTPAVGSDPVPAGFPDASTTGVPAGVRLRPYTGRLQITAPGTVISQVLITGCLTVRASRVTIRDSKIVCSEPRAGLSLLGQAVGSTVSGVEIDGRGVAVVGIDAKNAVIDRVNVHGTGDGVHLGRDVTLEDSYIHDLADQPSLHHDDLQTLAGSTATGIRVLHNTLQAYVASRQDNTVYHLGSGAISAVLVEDNFMDGGHYTIEVADGPTQRDITFRGNHFGRHYHYGILMLGHPGTAVSMVGNVFQDTGAPATAADSLGRGRMH